MRRAVTAALAEHGRLGVLHQYDLHRRTAHAPGTVHRQRLAACRRLAEQAFPARPPQGGPLIEALYQPDIHSGAAGRSLPSPAGGR